MTVEEDFDVIASRAVEPQFYEAPTPGNMHPMRYQLAGVEYGIARNNHLFGDAPGLGKTAECIILGNAIEAKRSLVVCPASLRLNWEREIWKWSTLPNVSTYPVLKSSDGVSHQHNYVILSYALLANPSILNAIMSVHWDHLILDEAHAVKDPKGNTRTKVICAPDLLPSVVGRITMASGTILPNQPIECLGADTLVLTDEGWKRIIDVAISDLLWDGVTWVRHSGVVYQGEKPVINLAGVDLTPDHLLLSGDDWLPAAVLAQNESTLSRALARGMASLPSWASNTDPEAEFLKSRFDAIAATDPSRRSQLILAMAALLNADPAELSRAYGQAGKTAATSPFAQMMRYGLACLAGCRTSYSVATTQRCLAIMRTAAEASASTGRGSRGARAGETSWPTSSPSRGTITQRCRSTAETWIKATSRAISASLRSSGTWATADQFAPFNSASMILKPVYDLTNAGPRRRFTILTDGGPAISHNCYNAIRLLNWEAINGASSEDFRETYYDYGEGFTRGRVFNDTTQAWEYKLHWSDRVRNVPRNLADLQFRLRKYIMVRRLKEQVLHELPPKVWHPFPLQPTADIRKALKHPGWKQAEKLYEMDADSFDGGIPVDGAISAARRELGEAKAPAIADYIEDLLAGGVEKLVVAAWHISVLKFLREKLNHHGLVYMDGGTSSAQKQAAVDKFQNGPETKIILGQTAVIGEGWTLIKAQDVVLAEPDWVPSRMSQAFDRIHRMGQVGSYVIAHIPVVPNTLDERIISTAIKKESHIYEALDKI